MYIHPFVCGIVFTILVEIGVAVAVAILLSRKPRNNETREDK